MTAPNYRSIANEVVELGESLFALALQEQVVQQASIVVPEGEQQAAASEQEQAYPIEEIRVAADDFEALRLLLGVSKT